MVSELLCECCDSVGVEGEKVRKDIKPQDKDDAGTRVLARGRGGSGVEGINKHL